MEPLKYFSSATAKVDLKHHIFLPPLSFIGFSLDGTFEILLEGRVTNWNKETNRDVIFEYLWNSMSLLLLVIDGLVQRFPGLYAAVSVSFLWFLFTIDQTFI
jgi:hypothetical protein